MYHVPVEVFVDYLHHLLGFEYIYTYQNSEKVHIEFCSSFKGSFLRFYPRRDEIKVKTASWKVESIDSRKGVEAHTHVHKHRRTNCKVIKVFYFVGLQLFWCRYVREWPSKKTTAMLKLWNKVCKTQQVLSKSSKFQLPITHCLTKFWQFQPATTWKSKREICYVLLCWTILFNRLASVGSL